MKLLNLEMRNFRQFLGEQEIVFASNADRNVTLIFGANGTGKTTILNAFTWALYGKLTPDLEHPERLINDYLWEKASNGDKLDVCVTVKFEHEDSVFTVQRTSEAVKSDRPQSIIGGEVSLVEIDSTGHSITRNNPSDVVDRILPERLHQFFFFNGERIERLAQPEAFEEIEEATKTLLGLEVLERAEKHLTKVSQDFERELRTVGSSEQRNLADSSILLRDQRKSLVEAKKESQANAVATEKRREVVASRLKKLAGARALQERRSELERSGESLKRQLEAARESQNRILATKGYQAFLVELGQEVSQSIGRLESRGELPTPIKKSFIAELLEDEECICGTHLKKGEDPYKRVSSYSEKAGLGDVEQKLIELKAHSDFVEAGRNEVSSELKQSATLISEIRTNLVRQKESLSEISKELNDDPSEEIRDLESQHAALIKEGQDLSAEQALIGRKIEKADDDLQLAEKNLKQAKAKNEQAALAQRRQAVSNEAEVAVRKIYALLKDEVRGRLDERIKKTFKDISYKDREPELSEAFELNLWDTAGGKRLPSAKSTGENMILSLSFVGGLASLARDQENRTKGGSAFDALISGRGGTFPIVMDAAFGNLDESYREDVARALPRLASQTVILVSKAQAEGEVRRELEDRVDRAYSIAYFTSKAGEDDDVVFNGRSYPYKVSTSDGIERAEIIPMDVPR